MNQINHEQRSTGRLILVWALGVVQVLTTAAIAAGVGALWSLSATMSAIVVEITTIKAESIISRDRHFKHEAELKRISDEQIRSGVTLEQLKAKK